MKPLFINKLGRPSKYSEPTHINGTINPIYDKWRGMHRRCKPSSNIRNSSYNDCYVCDEWFDYNNFVKWYNENFYQVDNEIMCLDKDILFKGNKCYSPSTCILVPSRINQLFESSRKSRGELPIGITRNKDKYIARCRYEGQTKYLGQYDTIEEAFYVYKHFKEEYIKYIAEMYKNKIPYKLYIAMYNYKVEITD